MSILDPREYQYWEMVIKSLQDIFEVTPTESSELVNTLVKRLHERPPEERLLFYHAEPLDVAAELAGEPATEPQIENYKTLANKFHWYRREDMG